MSDAIRQDAGLPGPGASDHEQRPFGRQDGLALSFVQVGEIGLRRRNAHRPTLAGRAAAAYQRTVSSTCAGIFGPRFVVETHVTRQVYVPFGNGSYDAVQ